MAAVALDLDVVAGQRGSNEGTQVVGSAMLVVGAIAVHLLRIGYKIRG